MGEWAALAKDVCRPPRSRSASIEVREEGAMAEAAEECLLHDVFGGLAAADEAVDEVVEWRAVALDEQGEIALILGGLHQDFFVGKFAGRFHYFTLSRGERRSP